MTMNGFSEKGQPQDWDVAVGTVRGFRWWQITVPLVQRHEIRTGLSWHGYWGNPCADVYYSAAPYDRQGRAWSVGKAYAEIRGMHGGLWRRPGAGTDGRYRATCAPFRFAVSDVLSPLKTHTAVPEPSCGCGFWAYWNCLPNGEFDTLPLLRYGSSCGYSLSIPLAGVIEGSGHTIIGTRGFRCEYARITDLAAAVDLSGVYYDQDKPPSHLVDLMSTSVIPIQNPVQKPDFLAFVHEETGIPPAVLLTELRTAASGLLGADFRWHANAKELFRYARRDENYAAKTDE